MELFQVPGSVRFPVELEPPPGFDPARVETWPRVEGRLEYVGGRLLYMPPCGDRQAIVAVDAVYVLRRWSESVSGYLIGGNEAGMHLGEDSRGAEATVWRRSDLKRLTGGFVHVPPILAVEVAGRDEGETELHDKAQWYLAHGVEVIWLVYPQTRTVEVVDVSGLAAYERGDTIPEHASLPGLTPPVADFFRQLDGR